MEVVNVKKTRAYLCKLKLRGQQVLISVYPGGSVPHESLRDAFKVLEETGIKTVSVGLENEMLTLKWPRGHMRFRVHAIDHPMIRGTWTPAMHAEVA